jgi:hypothetical protein
MYDIKPYIGSLSDWEGRLKRLEHKIPCLAPPLILLSLDLHERCLQILNYKLNRFIYQELTGQQKEKASENEETNKN